MYKRIAIDNIASIVIFFLVKTIYSPVFEQNFGLRCAVSYLDEIGHRFDLEIFVISLYFEII